MVSTNGGGRDHLEGMANQLPGMRLHTLDQSKGLQLKETLQIKGSANVGAKAGQTQS